MSCCQGVDCCAMIFGPWATSGDANSRLPLVRLLVELAMPCSGGTTMGLSRDLVALPVGAGGRGADEYDESSSFSRSCNVSLNLVEPLSDVHSLVAISWLLVTNGGSK